jgi:hypothetical protein
LSPALALDDTTAFDGVCDDDDDGLETTCTTSGLVLVKGARNGLAFWAEAACPATLEIVFKK